ncbi:hypothetical protein [Thermomonas sp.]|uniref:hypothetical protein n=1 Tax=Thermomonas sp. TaxID=1971895 RepID=UPI0025F97215|nr:hypothetical protein [Thermomonas sp.]
MKTTGQPTVILAKTVKGYGMGTAGEALNPTHQTKKLDDDAVRAFRDRFQLPIDDDQRRTARCRSTARTRSRRNCNTCANAAPGWAATCRSAGARPASSWKCPR